MAQPPSVPNRDGGSRWLLACGVGCGALLLIIVLGIVASITAVQYGMGQAVGQFRDGFADEYAKLQEEGKIPEEHAEVYERIFVVTQHEDTSFMPTMMGFLVTMGQLEDGEVTESEAKSAAVLADQLEQHPDMGIIEFAEFVEQNPEFQEAFEDAQDSMENIGTEWTEDAEVDEPFEESESL